MNIFRNCLLYSTREDFRTTDCQLFSYSIVQKTFIELFADSVCLNPWRSCCQVATMTLMWMTCVYTLVTLAVILRQVDLSNCCGR